MHSAHIELLLGIEFARGSITRRTRARITSRNNTGLMLTQTARARTRPRETRGAIDPRRGDSTRKEKSKCCGEKFSPLGISNVSHRRKMRADNEVNERASSDFSTREDELPMNFTQEF